MKAALLIALFAAAYFVTGLGVYLWSWSVMSRILSAALAVAAVVYLVMVFGWGGEL